MNSDPLALTGLRRQVLEQIVNSSSDGIVLADARSGDLSVLYVNPAYERLTGYSAEELAGTPWPVLQSGGQEEPELERLKHAIRRAQPCEVTLPVARKDGTIWFSQVSIEPLYGAEGEFQYFLCRERPASGLSEDSTLDLRLLRRELGRARQTIASMSQTDPATGLLRLEVFAEAYGLTRLDGLVDEVIRVQREGLATVHQLADRGLEPQVTWVADGYLAALRDRIAWSEEHRGLFE
jgi:PAS domain S-box-containing protein